DHARRALLLGVAALYAKFHRTRPVLDAPQSARLSHARVSLSPGRGSVIFQRSLIREFSLIAIAVVGVLLALMLTRLLIVLLGKAAIGDVPPEAVIGLIAFGVLTYLPILLGVAVFIAVLLALTRSYRDSEMTVWFTSGLSIAAWVKPVLQFSLPVAFICAL